MNVKTVYQTNHLGIFVSAIEADESPMEPGVFLVPGGCVEVAPPAIPELKAAWWDGKHWQLIDCFEGVVVYSIDTGEARTLVGLEPMPSGFTLSKPGPNQVWKNGTWVDDINAVLAALYQQKLESISADCTRYLASGFISEALGEPFRYASQMDDQVNLTGTIISGLDTRYPCFDADQVKAFHPHTAGQLLQVSQDLVRFRTAALQHVDGIKQDLASALKDKKLKVMKAIVWTPPA